MKILYKFYALFLLVVLVAGCGSSSDAPLAAAPAQAPDPEETRLQDSRTFEVAASALAPFDALADCNVETDRWVGRLDNSAYRIEVPKTTWNGMLVMIAHGYAGGAGSKLIVASPGFRRYLLENGYAWAASSYDKNYYDVRSGVEETNKLALNFKNIAEQNGRTLAAPAKIYITGTSMGGHVAAAAVDDEAYEYANNKVRYNGAVPMCGAVGDEELFNYMGAAQLTAQKLSGYEATEFPVPVATMAAISANMKAALFTTFPSVPTAAGAKWKGVMMNLTGGSRPMFDFGFAGPFTSTIWNTFGGDGTIDGILNKQGVDTNSFIYQFDADPTLTVEEYTFNTSIVQATAHPEANRLRRDGLRWIPKANGNFSVPVVTLHTLGDMYVPFSMEQILYRRAQAGTGKNWLVQRAIRGIGHCDFTVSEQVAALDAMLKWDQTGVKPDGDDVVTPATVANANYGCNYTNNTIVPDDAWGVYGTGPLAPQNTRPLLPACP